jgi:hypothetical protein
METAGQQDKLAIAHFTMMLRAVQFAYSTKAAHNADKAT